MKFLNVVSLYVLILSLSLCAADCVPLGCENPLELQAYAEKHTNDPKKLRDLLYNIAGYPGENLSVAELLIDRLKGTDLPEDFAATLFHEASEVSHGKFMDLLIKQGIVHVDVLRRNEPAIIPAAREGNWSSIFSLLANGADINARDTEGRTALMVASNHCRLFIVKLLLGAGADKTIKDNAGNTALSWSNNSEVTAVLESETFSVEDVFA